MKYAAPIGLAAAMILLGPLIGPMQPFAKLPESATATSRDNETIIFKSDDGAEPRGKVPVTAPFCWNCGNQTPCQAFHSITT